MLELDRPEEAEAPAREAADFLRVGGNWSPFPGAAFGPLAETVVRLGTPDAEHILAEGEQQVEASEQHLGRPPLLRARGLLLWGRGQVEAAREALHASAAVARSQHAEMQLGRTLAVLTELARQSGDEPLAAEADAERSALVAHIGPEVGGLIWAQGLLGRAHGISPPQRAVAGHDAGLLSPRERRSWC